MKLVLLFIALLAPAALLPLASCADGGGLLVVEDASVPDADAAD